jgi:hypothetical protein
VKTADEMEHAELVLKALTAAGALVAFVVGLVQYRRAQLWRRKEFISAAVRTFEENPHVRSTFLMIDWSTRRIPLDGGSKRDSWPRVTRALQVSALEPHNLRPIPDGADVEAFTRYSPVEAQIRDAYDTFFDGLARLANFSQAGLFEPAELLPYLQYWLEDMVAATGSQEDLRWRLALLAYVQFYRFYPVQALFRQLGVDITVKGSVWAALAPADNELARRLEDACIVV